MSLVKSWEVTPHLAIDVNNGIDYVKQVQLEARTAAPTDADLADGRIYYDSTEKKFYGRANGSFVNLGASGGGGAAVGDLDAVYSNGGNSVALDEGAITFTDITTGALNMIELVKTGAGSGNMLDFAVGAALTGNAIDIDMNLGIAGGAIYIDCGAGARTGSDIQVKADSTGNHSVIDIDESGSGNTIVLDIAQAGSGNVVGVKYVGSHNSTAAGNALYVDLNDGDNTACVPIYIAMGTGTRDVAGIQMISTHTGAGALIDLSMDGDATGDAITIDMNAGIDAKALYIDGGAGTRTDDLIGIKHDGDGNTDVIAIVATNTGSGAIIDINMDGDGSDAGVLNVDMNAAVGAEYLSLDAGGGTRTANLFEIKHDGDGNVDVFAIADSNTGSGCVFDIDMTGATATGAVFNVDMDAAVARPFLTLDYGDGTRTEDMCQVTFDGDGTVPFWDIDITNTGAGGTADYWDIDIDGLLTGSVLDITYGTAASTGDTIVITMGTAVGAAALSLTATGARSDDLIKISDASTGAAGRSIFDIDISGTGTFPVLDINCGNTSVNATPIKIATGTGARAVPIIDIDDAGDTADGAVHVFDIDLIKTGSGNVLDITYGTAANTGNAIDLNMGTNVAGMAISIASAATGTSGEGSAIDIAHTGNLAAGADLVRIVDAGNASSTSNLLFIEGSGTGTAGSYALFINATDSMEAIKVDAGTVTFDESLSVGTTLTVTGASTLTGAVSATAGVQFAGVARTATADGTGTAVIAAGTSWVTVTCDTATKWVTLPTPVLGNVIWLQEDSGQTGYEIRCADPANQYLNNVKGANVELAVAADTVIMCVCNEGGATGGYICTKFSNVGAPASAGTAGA